ncbi:hypothetical protein [Lyngbya aestuarii]|uniref:hypothetical protein n=1 Tax=Lyngbya aestuarii TaxID=118322 RepID=UPI00403D79C2
MGLRQQINPYVRQLLNNKVEQKIFFLHISKCGGTSISEAIKDSFGLTKCQQATNFFILNTSAARKCSYLLGDDLHDYGRKLLAYSMSNSQCRYIHGHFTYSKKISQEFSQDWNFITILRHPVSQWLSQYFYDTRENSEVRIESDLKSFLESERAIIQGNNYVWKLTDFQPNEASSDEAIEQAKENLEKFSLVGILENLDSFVKDYHTTFGAKLVIKHRNQSPVSKSKRQEQITDKIHKKIEELCQPNMRVYKAALERIQRI